MSPRVRRLRGLVAGVGLLAVAVLLLKPVEASFDDDPLLRLQAFDRPLGSLPTEVDCGAVLTSVRSPSSAASLYTLARDEACQREGYERLVAAIGAASALVVLTLLLLVAARPDEPGGMWPPRPRPPPPGERPERRAEERHAGPEPSFKARRAPTPADAGAEVEAESEPDGGADDDEVPALSPAEAAR